MKRGAVHWVSMDKRRPAVIVSPDDRNDGAGDVIVVPCSASGRSMRWHVELRKGEGGLPQASMAKCEQVTTLPKYEIESDPMGTLGESRMREIERAMMSALGISR